jgi:hypothetical protein
MLAIVRVPFDGSARPCKAAAACWVACIFRKDFRQCVSELTIKCRNVGAGTHNRLREALWSPHQ